MKELLFQTYTIVLPILLGYIVWLLKNQKKDRDANSKGTMLLLRVQLVDRIPCQVHETWIHSILCIPEFLRDV
nr:MAG TPA: hypothetical protein [Caudoviricetes sp.]